MDSGDARHGIDPPPEAGPTPDRSVERRIVSVLFVDLVGFTPLSERLDAEDVATVQDAYFATVTETVGRYGGRLEKFIGDAAMAVFGLPHTRDDDAERAVRAGLALAHAVEALAGRLGLETGDLRVRVGVNTGEVVTSDGGGPSAGAGAGAGEAVQGTGGARVTGDTVNTAARLQSAAPPGRVLLGETTALAVAESIGLERVEPIILKGKTEPSRASLATGVRPERSREIAMGGLHAPLLGRDGALAQLADLVSRASAGNLERLLLVAPPGVGKTRLVEEALARLDGACVRRARLHADTRSPFEPIVQLLAERPGSEPVGYRHRLLDRLRRAGVTSARSEVVAEDVLRLVSPPGADLAEAAAEAGGASGKAATFDAWATAIDSIDVDAPAVWFIEDLHWADPDFLEFLDVAHARPRAAGRAIVATARPSLLERLGGDAAGGQASWPILDLPALDDGSAAELVRALVGTALPEPLLRRIVERSDGNCLFIEELIRTWVSVGILVASDAGGSWTLAIPEEEAALPATVQAIYAAQLDDLPSDARTAARRAAVAGRQFPVAALDALGVVDIEPSLAVLLRRALIAGPQPDPLIGDGYAYRHALLRDAGYASLARAERARLHVRLARWLEGAAGDHVSEVAEAIGGHYEAALANAPALAAEVGDGLDRGTTAARAAQWLELAGDAALERFASEAARSAFRRSLDHSTGASDLEIGRRWRRLGTATGRAADLDAAALAFERAEEAFGRALRDDASPPDVRDDARRGLAGAAAERAATRFEQLRFAETQAIAESALELVGTTDPRATIPLLLVRIRGLEGLTNEYRTLFHEAQGVLEVAQGTGDPELIFEARRETLGLGQSAGVTSPEAWLEFATEASRLGRWDHAAGSIANAAALLFDSDRARTRLLASQAEEIAEARGLTERVAWICQLRAEVELGAGDWGLARREGIRAVDLADAKGYSRAAVRTWFAVTPIASAIADRDLLARAAAWFERHRGDFPDSPYGLVNHAAVDLRLAAAGLVPPPDLDPDRLLAGFDIADDSPSWLASIERIVEGWLGRGTAEVAAEAAARYRATNAGNATARVTASLSLVDGLVAVEAGRAGDAAVAARAAIDAGRAAGAPWWTARALRLLAAVDPAAVGAAGEADGIETALGIRGAGSRAAATRRPRG